MYPILLTNCFFLKHLCSRISPTHRCLQCTLGMVSGLPEPGLPFSLCSFSPVHHSHSDDPLLEHTLTVCDVHITIKDLSAIYPKLISLSTFYCYFLCPWLISFIRIHTGIHTITYLPVTWAEWKMKGIFVGGWGDRYIFIFDFWVLTAGRGSNS